MRVNIYASFNDTSAAQNAVGALLDHGVRQEDITLVLPSSASSTEEGVEKAQNTIAGAESGITTTTTADAAVGATKGTLIGFGVGALAALAAILVPGVGLVVGGGALATALIGTTATTLAGTLAGGVTGYLKDQGVPANEVVHFTNVYEGGGAILVVSTPSNGISATEMESVLGKYDSAQIRIWKGDTPLAEVEGIAPTAVVVDPTVTEAIVAEPRPQGLVVERTVVANPVGIVEEVAVIKPAASTPPAPVVDIAGRVEPAMVVESANPDEDTVVVHPPKY